MTLQNFYNYIQNNNIPDSLVIFKNLENNFIANQYIDEIARQHNLQKQIVEDLDCIKLTTSIFDTFVEPKLQIFKVDKFDYPVEELKNAKNLVISCSSISKETAKIFQDYIIEVPKLEKWQIKDFLYSQLEGTDLVYLDWLADICPDIYRIQLEIDRLKIFSSEERKFIIEAGKKEFLYDDLTQYSIFDFTNAILVRDIPKIKQLYLELKNIDYTPIGLLIILYNNFKNIINIQLNPVATPESCGLKPGQFWAIKNNNINKYSKEQLFKIFSIITNIDKQIKTGELPVELVLDYLLTSILTE